MDPKTVLFTRLATGTDPSQVLCAGPWCFIGREEEYQPFEQEFSFAPEPLSNACAIEQAIELTCALVAKMLPPISRFLCVQLLPQSYWQTLLCPWLASVSEQIIERWLRIEALKERFGTTELLFPLLPCDLTFSFASEQDFVLNGALGETFNHWLFSYLLQKSRLPRRWKITSVVPQGEVPTIAAPKKNLRSLIRNTLLKLPMPHLKGMKLTQTLLFSWALYHRSLGQDHSRSLRVPFESEKALAHLDLPDVLPIFLNALPRSIACLTHPKHLHQAAHPRTFCASIALYEDALYRQRLACLRGQGHRLICVQHGGNYGQVRRSCVTDLVEYHQHAFITWGWKNPPRTEGNFIPLPAPQLFHEAKNVQPNAHGPILFVGTEMPLYGYRLDCHPTPLQIVAYFRAKTRFFTQLTPQIHAQILYRPYFPVPSTLKEWPSLHRDFPALRLCEGSLLEHMRTARLLILDHHGTTLLEAMAANIPVVLYWNPAHWPVTEPFEKLLQALYSAAIWFPTPEEAASQVTKVADHAVEWWQERNCQQLRSRFCDLYALVGTSSLNHLWFSTLRSL